MKDLKFFLGKRIKEIRKQKDITQETLAELVDIDQRSLSHIENGYTFPSKSLQKIAKALNVTLSDLFDFEHIKYTNENKKDYIISALKELSEENINIVFRLIKSMK